MLVNGPFASHAASVAGREVAALLVAVVAATGVAWMLVDPVVRRIPAPSRKVAVGLAATAAAALVVAVALSHPLARLHSFAKPPVASDTPSFVRTHLVSGSSSGRWQFWTAAVDQWQSAPVVGAGAGTFAAWWAEHGSLPMFVRNAHSLYLESLGELGAVGFLLASAIWVGGCAIGVRACRRLGRRGADVTRGRHRRRPRVRSRRRSGLALAASRGLAGRGLGARPRPRSSSS